MITPPVCGPFCLFLIVLDVYVCIWLFKPRDNSFTSCSFMSLQVISSIPSHRVDNRVNKRPLSVSTSTGRQAQPRRYKIGESLEVQSHEDVIPMGFREISDAFRGGMRGCLIRETFTVFCVCCCRKINHGNSSVEIISDEGSSATMMFPDNLCIFWLDGVLDPLDEYTAFGFKLGDVISDPFNMFFRFADGWDPTSEESIASRGLPVHTDEITNLKVRQKISNPDQPDIFAPPLPYQYANLPKSDKVFRVYCSVRNTSVYAGGIIKDPEVGQLIARLSETGCHMLALIVHVSENYLILRDSTDYATRRIHRRWASTSRAMESPNYACILRLRRLDWWMAGSCKCVPKLPRLQRRYWRLWYYSQTLYLHDGALS
jgi:hypothetical protein